MELTFAEHSFRECVENDEDLAAMRATYARESDENRRRSADWEYHSAIAGRMFNNTLAGAGADPPDFCKQRWPEGVIALAIDPSFAPAILTVGSIEYQLGREDDAMSLFMTLTTLPADEPDLPLIIDKAGDFLLDEEDYESARDLHAAAVKAFPDVAVYPVGLSYCLSKLGLYEDALAKARRADELEPDNYIHLNDLGWALYEAGCLKQAEQTLNRSIDLAPDGYEFARNNLKEVREALRGCQSR
jgi:tetratricopeptide (TPR) repeat protein